jgi:hypothetical protein
MPFAYPSHLELAPFHLPPMSSTSSDLLSTRFQALLSQRAYPKTICPSEVARSLSASDLRVLGVSSWRDLMPRLRQMAFKARDRGEVQLLQRGSIIGSEMGLEDVRGPIRVRLMTEDGEDGEDGEASG